MARLASVDSAYGHREYQEAQTVTPATTDIPLDSGAPTTTSPQGATPGVAVVPGPERGALSWAAGMLGPGRKAGSGVRVIEGSSEPQSFGSFRF